MITIEQFYKGRDKAHADEMTDLIRASAPVTVEKANELLAMFFADLPAEADRSVNSGWRDKATNAATPGASPTSKHLYGQAVDLSDEDGALDAWCMAHQGVLESIGLWLEHPFGTPRWCHVQTVPPHSGARVFFP